MLAFVLEETARLSSPCRKSYTSVPASRCDAVLASRRSGRETRLRLLDRPAGLETVDGERIRIVGQIQEGIQSMLDYRCGRHVCEAAVSLSQHMNNLGLRHSRTR